VEEEEEEGEEVKGRYALGAKIPEFVKVGEKGKHFKNLGTSTFSCTVADVIFDAAAALAGDRREGGTRTIERSPFCIAAAFWRRSDK